MSGHSKWANIQHRKGRQDAKRSNLWTKVIREIIVAARLGGGDPDMNPRLRLSLLKARAANVPKDTVKNAILKGTGQLEGAIARRIADLSEGSIRTRHAVKGLKRGQVHRRFAAGKQVGQILIIRFRRFFAEIE